VESEVNGFKIKIAIECKEHKRKVGSSLIEAFHGKCLRIPDINKKVLVSSNGFTKGAIETAEDFDIELFTLEKLSVDSIKNWIIIKKFQALKSNRVARVTRLCSELIAELDGKIDTPTLITHEFKKGIFIKDYLLHFVTTELPGKVVIFGGRKIDELTLDLVIEFNKAIYINKNKVYKLSHIHFQLIHTFEKIESTIEQKKLSKIDTKSEILETATMLTERGDIFSLIKKSNSNLLELITNKGEDFVVAHTIDLENQNDDFNVTIGKDAIILSDKIETIKADNKS